MTRTQTSNRIGFPTQGTALGWTLWSLLCLLALFGISRPAHAGTFTPSQTTFAPLTVGQTSAPTIVSLTAGASGTARSPIALTEGVSTSALSEFALSDPGTCGSSPGLAPGQSCTVSVTFTPRFPGVRHGAILLKTSAGQLLASTLLSGIGQGSLPVFIPGQIDTVAGDGQWFYQGDNVPATQAPIYLPSGLAVDGAGNLFLADTINNRVRRVDAVTQIITTVAGVGSAGYSGDSGPATAAAITSPTGLALDGAGNLYIADTGNNVIRRVDAVSGVITTVAGTPGQSGYTGDGGPATAAKLNAPQGIALTASGDLVIADTANAVIRVVTVSDGQIQTIAGTGTAGYNGDGILASTAQLNQPSGIAIRADGAIAIADLSNNRVRLMTAGGNITTFAGNGSLGYAGDNGPATQAEMQEPAAVAFDPAGDLFIADSVNNCIRLVFGPQKTIVTLSGVPSDDRYAGDGGPENQARMHGPNGLFFDAGGNLWLSDRFNNRVRKVSGSLLTIGPYPTMKVGKTSQPVAEAIINAGNQPLILNAPTLQQAALDAATTNCGQSPVAAASFCNMGIEFAPTSVGSSINGSINWTSNAPNATPVDQLYGQVLSVEPTTAAITSSANPGLLNQPITLTAAVTSDDTGRTGTVDFVESGHTWCSGVPLAADGTAGCTVPSLSLGNHNFTANYSGDNNNAASQSPVYTETIKQQAALALGVSSSPSVVTGNVVLTISAADSYGGTPTGTVVFYDGTAALATVTLDANGNASWNTTSFAVGTHTLTAQYSGDASNVPGTSSARSLEIDQATTTTLLSSSNNNATVGSTVTLAANVISNNGPAPTGTVQFLDGSTSLGSSAVSSTGTASITTNSLTPGTHNLTAVYSGDTDNATSSSAPLPESIQQIGTGTTLGADVDPLNAGATLHLTAIVALASGVTPDGAISGIVVFRDGNTVLGSAPVNATGQASLAVNSMAVGPHTILASFSGNTNYAPSNSTTLNETVQQSATAVTLSSASATTLEGKPASFTAAVASANGTPTGSVVFKDGARVLGTSPLAQNSTASFTTTSLSTGSHSITAVYSGDTNYLSSTSSSLQQTVNLAETSLSLGGPTNPVDAGTAAQFVAMLTTPGITPTGTLTLLDGAALVGSLPVTAAGSFTFTNAQLSVGTHHLTASYSGDTNNAPVLSAAINVNVQQANTLTTLTPSANPLTVDTALLLSASVKSDSPNELGNVSFYDGSTLLATVPLGPDGTASFASQHLALGPHTLTAVYAGDTNHAGSTSMPIAELVVQNSSVTVTSSVNPSVSGQNVTFSVQVQGSPVPTGTVAFRDNGSTLATVPLNVGALATFSTPALSVGAHTISVVYSGDSNFSTSSAQLTQTVINASTRTTLTASSNPATYGQPLTLSASVASNGGAATGTVAFTESGAPVGSTQLDSDGNAVITVSTLAPGPHTLVASYVGDGKASSSASSTLVLAVKQTTAVAVSSTANPAQTLSAVTFVASIANPGAASPTGTVTFTDGSASLGSAPVDSTGHASLTVPQLAAGSHSVVASYSGDGADFPSQSATFNENVQLRPTSATVTGTSTDQANPQQVTLIAVVHGAGAVPPSGTVNFTNGDITLGAAAVDATGVATITVIFDTPLQGIVASYNGDASYSSSQSAATPIKAGRPAQFTIALSAPTLTLVSHQHTTLSVTVSSVKGFTDTIALGCLGLPYAATCTFDKSQVKLNPNGTETASLLVDTGDPLGAGTSTTASVQRQPNTLLCALPLGMLLGVLSRKRRKRTLPFLLTFVVGLALAAGISGCSGLQMSGTPAGTYSFRVIGTGQGSNATEAQTVTLVVTQ